MVVAARAAHRQAEKNLSCRACDFVEEILPELSLEIRVRFPGSHAQKPQRDQPLVAVLRRGGLLEHLVARELLLDELIVRFVLIE